MHYPAPLQVREWLNPDELQIVTKARFPFLSARMPDRHCLVVCQAALDTRCQHGCRCMCTAACRCMCTLTNALCRSPAALQFNHPKVREMLTTVFSSDPDILK